jgi:putative chitinase
MNIEQLRQLAPKAVGYLGVINEAMARFGIDSTASQAAFLAQMLHESAHFTKMTENLNYSPASLMSTFNTSKVTRFTPETAGMYGRIATRAANQQMIANIAYANRMGNGPVESGDGWRYRGRGPGQLTGTNNYRACGAAIGMDLLSTPDQVALPEVGCLAFAWFWSKGNRTGKSLNHLAEAGRIDEVSIAVNGGALGLGERARLTQTVLAVLA